MFIKNGFQSRRGLFTLVAGFVLLAGAATARAADNPKVTMTVENRGTLVIELYQKEAPKTVAHFWRLSTENSMMASCFIASSPIL